MNFKERLERVTRLCTESAIPGLEDIAVRAAWCYPTSQYEVLIRGVISAEMLASVERLHAKESEDPRCNDVIEEAYPPVKGRGKITIGNWKTDAEIMWDKETLEAARKAMHQNLPEGCKVVSEAEYANDLVQPGPNRYVLQGRCFGLPIVKRRSFCELEPAKVLKPEEPPDEGTWRTRKGLL